MKVRIVALRNLEMRINFLKLATISQNQRHNRQKQHGYIKKNKMKETSKIQNPYRANYNP